jgi:hypothetical protein
VKQLALRFEVVVKTTLSLKRGLRRIAVLILESQIGAYVNMKLIIHVYL